jgi:predicted GNAT family N-acyltransferase
MPELPGGFEVELLRKDHNRDGFDCGNTELNAYLRTQARQEMERGAAVVYVVGPQQMRADVAGFYTLSSTTVKLGDWPDAVRKKLPRYPLVPATLIGRLAVSASHKGRGLGEQLLIDALRRSLAASQSVGSTAVVVDAKHGEVVAFYLRYGFIPFPDQPHRLFIPMKTIAGLAEP